MLSLDPNKLSLDPNKLSLDHNKLSLDHNKLSLDHNKLSLRHEGFPRNKLSSIVGWASCPPWILGRVGTPIPQENLGYFFIWKSPI